MKKFGFKRAVKLPKGMTAQTAGRALERIRKASPADFGPREVVRKSRPKSAPLHECFEWDESKAATAFREHQARMLINCITIQIGEEDHETQAFVSTRFILVDDECRSDLPKGGHYTAVEDAMEHTGKRDKLFAYVAGRLRRLRDEYKSLQELSKVWEVIDETVVA